MPIDTDDNYDIVVKSIHGGVLPARSIVEFDSSGITPNGQVYFNVRTTVSVSDDSIYFILDDFDIEPGQFGMASNATSPVWVRYSGVVNEKDIVGVNITNLTVGANASRDVFQCLRVNPVTVLAYVQRIPIASGDSQCNCGNFQVVAVEGIATGGSFDLLVNYIDAGSVSLSSTVVVDWDESAAELLAKLQALPSMVTQDLSVQESSLPLNDLTIASPVGVISSVVVTANNLVGDFARPRVTLFQSGN